jgi:hypothetical protein
MDQGLARRHAAAPGGFESECEMFGFHGDLSSTSSKRQSRAEVP